MAGITSLFFSLVFNSCTDKEEDMWLFQTSLGSVSTEDNLHGIDNTGATEVSAEIQALMDANVGSSVTLGNSPADLYSIDNSLIVPSNLDFTFNGTLRIADANIRDLTADFVDGQNTIQVADADLYFKVGQRIVISDDEQPINGGGAWKTRKVGQTNIIASVSSTTITCEYTLSNTFYGGFYTSENAKVSTANSVFVIESVDNSTIQGVGVLDGNLANQYNIAGANYNRTVEDLLAACGIGQFESDNIIVDGLTIKHHVMHGIATNADNISRVNTDCEYRNLVIDGCVDKAFAGLDLDRFIIDNVTNKNGVDEGEIILYNGCTNGTVSNITSFDNRRYGVATTGVDNGSNTFTNLNLYNNGTYDLYVQNQISGSDFFNVTTSGTGNQAGSISIVSSADITMDGVYVSEKSDSGHCISVTATASASNTCDRILIKNLDITNSNGWGRAFILEDGVDCTVEGFTVDDVRVVFRNSTGNVNFLLKDGVVTNYNAVYELNDSVLIFDNVTFTP